ncbi:MAG: DNA translocase FtsK [Methylococcaceae bacterium]|nr:MAG: DNA translocase FtsK [Methylococcaceae bacterium]
MEPRTDSPWNHGLRELVFLGHCALALFLALALYSYDLRDGGWSHSGGDTLHNTAGAVGAWVADMCFHLVGVVAYLLPLAAAYWGYQAYRGAGRSPVSRELAALRTAGALVAVLTAAALLQTYFARAGFAMPSGNGGILGGGLVLWLLGGFGSHGAKLLLWVGFLGSLTLAADISWIAVVDWVGQQAIVFTKYALLRRQQYLAEQRRRQTHEPVAPVAPVPDGNRAGITPAPLSGSLSDSASRRLSVTTAPVPAAPPPQATPGFNKTVVDDAPTDPTLVRATAAGRLWSVNYAGAKTDALPGLDLLSDGKNAAKVKSYSPTDLENMARSLETILDDFGVSVEVMEIHPGPVITRFELQPAAGVKVSRITGLAKDLARALLVPSVRIVEIIPGKSFVGIEIPNQEREMVLMREVLASSEYSQSESHLTLVLGKDISGRPTVANLAKMPHLLVAGTTGSGKSVAVNVMILSLLYKATPDQVRLIMIDPKMLELSVYESIPHLLTPVVTDMKEAANALRWCVAEMERRYKLMSKLGVRNIIGYNEKVAEGAPIRDPMIPPGYVLDEGMAYPTLTPLPYIVIVIDELADLMMIVGKKVEELIARLAQKARAAGLHLILATQRPSVDVITGLIKANIPTRVAFQVSSKIDSRTIIDQGGAEALLGNGDMLYLPPGSGLPMRVHGAFVPDAEVHRVVEFLKQTGPANYLEDITRFSAEGSENSGGGSGGGGGAYSGEDSAGEGDALYDEAVRFVTESRKASISSVQRKLQVGYNRAARMIEEMEKAGIVGPAERNGNRTVLAPAPPEI